MLIDEAHVAMGLNHSNIVQVLDLGHARGRYFLVMELVDGWDLSQILSRAVAADFPIPAEILLYIAAEVCRALAYAHARTRYGNPLAIVHRDISPQNVLVSEQGEVKLTDFGIAKAMGRRERTNQGVIKGKLAFMSPEQASGAVLDNRSDLFSLGTMLYLLFTGRRPFEAPTDLESIMRVRECRFAPPEEVKPGLAPALTKIIRRAMQSAPSDRYQNADEMLVDIENVQRTVYRPAGQTELKRWLAGLAARDHCPTISRAAAAKPLSVEDEELDLGEGAEVVFDESGVVDIHDIVDTRMPLDIEDVVRGIQPTIAASSNEISGIHPRTEEKTTAATPVAIKESSIPTRIIVLALVVVAAALGAWLFLPGNSQHSSGRRSDVRSRHRESVSKAAIEPRKGRPSKPIDAGAEPAPAAPAAKPAVDAEIAAAPSRAAAAVPTEGDEEEENLLKQAEPDDGERVIGEDEGVGGRKASPAKTSKTTPEPVSVRVLSYPDGAVVSVGKRVFGRAPMNLRFRPGITFELKFVKRGYQPTIKRLVVANRKNQTVKAFLKKKPAPRKSLLRRIFGR
jgi:serine/threonine protein kinase